MEARVMPNDLQAEQCCLASAMMDREAAEKMLSRLVKDDFYHEKHKVIFTAIWELHERGQTIDMSTVSSELISTNSQEQAGGLVYLSDCVDALPTSAHIDSYIETVLQKTAIRAIIDMCTLNKDKAYEDSREPESLFEKMKSEIEQIEKARHRLKEFDLSALIERVNEDIERGRDQKRYYTGLSEIDRCDVLKKGHTIVIGGRPSVGKSSLALQIGNANLKEGVPVLIFSGEMPKEDYIKRLYSLRKLIPSHKFAQPERLKDKELVRMYACAEELALEPLVIRDHDFTIADIRQEIIQAKKEHESETAVVIVDALNDLYLREKTESRRLELAKIITRLQIIARETEAILILVCHLVKNISGRPSQSDLKESGEIPYKADIIFLLDRDDIDEQEDIETIDAEAVMLRLTKNRNGRTFGWTRLYARWNVFMFFGKEEEIPQ